MTLSFEERQRLRVAVSEGVRERIPVQFTPRVRSQLADLERQVADRDGRILELQREVWDQRRRVRFQQNRAELWKYRALNRGKKAA